MGLPRLQRLCPFSSDAQAVAIAVIPTPDDHHAGIFFLDEDSEPSVLHLAFHEDLRLEQLSAGWVAAAWAEPEILPERAEAAAALCGLVARVHRRHGLPYALRYAEGVFDIGTGQIQLGPGCVGFTCSTFVIGIFKSCKIALLRQDEWRERPGDNERQTRLVAMLAERQPPRGKVTPEHLQAVAGEVGCVRFSPLDVGASACIPDLPLGFARAVELGGRLRELLVAAR